MHIPNLYRPEARQILLFKRCYALEKLHGTSSSLHWDGEKVGYFAGGAPHAQFMALFPDADLTERFRTIFGAVKVVVYGEAYGGKMQGMSKTYGPNLRFCAFDVQVNGKTWLNVPNAAEVAAKLGLEFVHYEEVAAELPEIDAQRDAPSVQAIRNGCGNDKLREGVVLRPLYEMTLSNGERVMCKHKREEFRETKTPRNVSEEEKQVFDGAEAVAEEYVCMERLRHVLDKLPECTSITHTGTVVRAMVEDVVREGNGEFVWSKPVEKAIGKKTVELFKAFLASSKSPSEV